MEATEKSADPFIRNPSNAIEADHYAPMFACLNLRDPVIREHWLKCWGAAASEIGLSGVFLDSSFNLSSDKFHWIHNPQAGSQGATMDQTHLLKQERPAIPPRSQILSMYRDHLTLVRAMQMQGYRYSGEDLGVFGVNRCGPDAVTRLQAAPMWANSECDFDADALHAVGWDLNDAFFRGLACRLMWKIYWIPQANELSWRYGGRGSALDAPTEWQLAIYHCFNVVEPDLMAREVLAGDRGILYHHGDCQVLWSFADFTWELNPGETLSEVTPSGLAKVSGKQVRRHAVYRITAVKRKI